MANLRQYAFFIALVVALVLGFTDVAQLEWLAANVVVRGVLVAIILFLTAVSIDFYEFQEVLRRPLGVATAFVISFVVIPLLAVLIGQPFDEHTRLGILVMAAAPATMSSATVWTGRANGNQALSLAISMLANCLCFLLTPLTLAWLAQLPAGTSVQVPELMRSLFLLVILPITMAQLVRRHKAVPRLCRRFRASIDLSVQVGVLIMALFGATVTGMRMRELESKVTVLTVLGVVAAVVILRGMGLATGIFVTRSLKMRPADSIATTIGGSQKTLVVGLQVGMDLGCSILPIIGYHIAQLMMDTIFANWVRIADDESTGSTSDDGETC